MRAAAIQFFARPFDLNRNLDTAERLIRQAASQRAQIAALPAFFNTGRVFSRRLPAAAETADGPTIQRLTALSAELQMHLAGSLLAREGGHTCNVFAFVEPSGAVHRYRQRHLFLWDYLYFESRREPLIVNTALGRIGLMLGWDAAHRDVWESYRGQADLLLLASAAPRFHRAVLNFPLGKKLYTAEIIPALLREREEIDRWFAEGVGARAAQYGLPLIHSAMAGRFVTELPLARLSLLAAAIVRPKLWPLAAQAHLATLRATFYGPSAIFDAGGQMLARVAGEEGVSIADLRASPMLPSAQASVFPAERLPVPVRLMQIVLPLLAALYRRQ